MDGTGCGATVAIFSLLYARLYSGNKVVAVFRYDCCLIRVFFIDVWMSALFGWCSRLW